MSSGATLHCCGCAGADLGRLCRANCEGMYCDEHLALARRAGVLDELNDEVDTPPEPWRRGRVCEVCGCDIYKEPGSPGRIPKVCSDKCRREKLRRYHRKRNALRRNG